ncbi:hypothetical protein BKK44_08310 [Bacillus cereus]|nr:hypothetical protein BKK44_08310 [Bacillus cereus]
MFKKITSGILVTGLLFTATGNVFAAEDTNANNEEVSYSLIAAKAADVSKKGYQLPLAKFTESSKYNEKRGNKNHKGIDFAAPKGTKVMAAKGGKVVFAAFGKSGSGYSGYGNVVVIEHDDKRWTLYGHLDKISVEKGDKVKIGEKIGEVGSTGDSTGNHLHFEVREKLSGGQVDPGDYLPSY